MKNRYFHEARLREPPLLHGVGKAEKSWRGGATASPDPPHGAKGATSEIPSCF